LDGLTVEPAGGERNAAVGAEVLHGEEGAVGLFAEQDGDAEEEGGGGLAFAEGVGAGGGIPVAEDKLGGRAGDVGCVHRAMITGLVFKRLSCRTGPLRAGRPLRDFYTCLGSTNL